MGLFQAPGSSDLGLNLEQFCQAFSRLGLGDSISQEELALLFMKIDTSCDGWVDWDEFCT